MDQRFAQIAGFTEERNVRGMVNIRSMMRRIWDTRAWHNGHMTGLGLLAEEVGVSERTLRRAVGVGTLRGGRSTPRKLELSLGERDYVRRSWGLVSALRAALRTESNVRFALLFGSAATGADVRGSDVDVLVDLRDGSFERFLDLAAKLGRLTGRRIDLTQLEDAESEPSFLAHVLADGRVLVDREGLWPSLRAREEDLRRRGVRQDARRLREALAGVDRLLAS
jgi:predicted nucleotidyltransferase